VDQTWEGMRGAESGAAGNRIESGSETVGSRGMTGGDHLSAAVGGGEAGRCRWLLGRAGPRGAAQTNKRREFGVRSELWLAGLPN
jgi:hypothetical protein